jgi:hypothetical protein
LHRAAEEECVASDEEGIWALALKGGKGRIDLADGHCVENLDLQPDGARGFLNVLQLSLGIRIGGV